MTVMNREAILNAVDTNAIIDGLPKELSSMERADLSKEGTELLVNAIFDQLNTDVIDVAEEMADEILSTAMIDVHGLVEDMEDSLYLTDWMQPGKEFTFAEAKEVAEHLAKSSITGVIADAVRSAIEKTTGEDPCSLPNELQFPEDEFYAEG